MVVMIGLLRQAVAHYAPQAGTVTRVLAPDVTAALTKAAERSNFDASAMPHIYAVLILGLSPDPKLPKKQA